SAMAIQVGEMKSSLLEVAYHAGVDRPWISSACHAAEIPDSFAERSAWQEIACFGQSPEAPDDREGYAPGQSGQQKAKAMERPHDSSFNESTAHLLSLQFVMREHRKGING